MLVLTSSLVFWNDCCKKDQDCHLELLTAKICFVSRTKTLPKTLLFCPSSIFTLFSPVLLHRKKPRMFMLHLQSQAHDSPCFNPKLNSTMKRPSTLLRMPRTKRGQSSQEQETGQISSSSEVFPMVTGAYASRLRGQTTKISSA